MVPNEKRRSRNDLWGSYRWPRRRARSLAFPPRVVIGGKGIEIIVAKVKVVEDGLAVCQRWPLGGSIAALRRRWEPARRRRGRSRRTGGDEVDDIRCHCPGPAQRAPRLSLSLLTRLSRRTRQLRWWCCACRRESHVRGFVPCIVICETAHAATCSCRRCMFRSWLHVPVVAACSYRSCPCRSCSCRHRMSLSFPHVSVVFAFFLPQPYVLRTCRRDLL